MLRLDANSDHIGFIVPLYVPHRRGAADHRTGAVRGRAERRGRPEPGHAQHLPRGEGQLHDVPGRRRQPVLRPAEAGGPWRRPRCPRIGLWADAGHPWLQQPERAQVRVQRVHDGYKPKLETYFFVAILHDPSETRGPDGPLDKVLVAGQEIGPIRGASPEDRAGKLNDSPGNAFYYDENVNITFFKVIDNSSDILLELQSRGHAAGYGYHPPEP